MIRSSSFGGTPFDAGSSLPALFKAGTVVSSPVVTWPNKD